jgi:DNA-binding protein YbaB
MTTDAVRAAMRHAVEQAALAEADPAAALLTEIPGRSRAGRVTVWVDAVGRLLRVKLDRGAAQEGDEANLAAAVMEAYEAAVAESSARAAVALAELADDSGRGRR